MEQAARVVWKAQGYRDGDPEKNDTLYLCNVCLPGVEDFFTIEHQAVASVSCDRCGAAAEARSWTPLVGAIRAKKVTRRDHLAGEVSFDRLFEDDGEVE